MIVLGMMRLSKLFYLLLLLFSQQSFSSPPSSSSSSALVCSQHQSSELLQFKQLFSFSKEASSFCEAAGHHSYPKMESWKQDTDCCSWDGVMCDNASGDVIGLDLSCSWLNGTIPSNSFLFHLPYLQHLNLAYNYFNHSPISFGFGQVSRLRYLNLSYSMFSGQVPYELSHLSKLASLDLSGYGNVSLETSLVKRLVQNLTKLRELHLDHVDMSSVSLSSFMNLSSSLTSLTLNSCLLRGRLLDHIFCLPNLRELRLADNPQLTWFFPMVNSSKALRFLDVSYTIHDSGELPKSIGELKFLRHLIVSGCNFYGPIPTWLGNLTQLTLLNLSANNFAGEIPSSLSNLKALSSLDIRSNNLSGAIPVWLGNLTRVTEILFGNNSFTGQIPSSLIYLKDLNFLGLKENNIQGKIPSFLTNLTKLTSVFLSYNQLSSFGEFQFSNSSEVLALSNNKLYGSIPKSLSNLANLAYLDISSNELTGIVDIDMFRKLKKLETLNLHANLLNGEVPVLPSSMQNLFISNNRLSGEIPSMICNITFLTILDISNNSLSGTIPSCLGNFSNSLSVMNLRMNNFHGIIPENFAKGNRLRTLAFNGNLLEGLLPKSLVNCINLEVLDLGNNKINDSFPYWLVALPKLQVLVLRSNKFHGPIENYETSGMFFSKLQILDLSHNEFIGPLPSHFFEDLKALTTNESEDDPKYIGENFYHGLPGEYVMENYLFLQYQDSVIIAMKGNVLPLKKILTIFSIIDLSRNMFYGKIPKVLGTLKFLRVLNFSHNRLNGHIPSSLANLSVLESLDLSSNMLTGEIPMQLTSLTFLAVLNLSQNLLTGPIPQGKQFNTFQNASYDGNLGLCGFPLSMKCSIDETPSPPTPQSIFEEDNDSMFASGFGWKSVLMGYGCGLVVGMAMGYIVFKIGKPHWLVRFVEALKEVKWKDETA